MIRQDKDETGGSPAPKKTSQEKRNANKKMLNILLLVCAIVALIAIFT